MTTTEETQRIAFLEMALHRAHISIKRLEEALARKQTTLDVLLDIVTEDRSN